jgi:hypothetical protein
VVDLGLVRFEEGFDGVELGVVWDLLELWQSPGRGGSQERKGGTRETALRDAVSSGERSGWRGGRDIAG